MLKTKNSFLKGIVLEGKIYYNKTIIENKYEGQLVIMITVIYGKKGSGKTKRMIDMANDSVKSCDGDIIYLHVNNKYMYELPRDIRFIDTSEYGLSGAYMVYGFLNGLIASNYDVKMIYIDSFQKMMDRPLDQLEELFGLMDGLAAKNNIELVLAISVERHEMPEFMLKYIE